MVATVQVLVGPAMAEQITIKTDSHVIDLKNLYFCFNNVHIVTNLHLIVQDTACGLVNFHNNYHACMAIYNDNFIHTAF